MTRIDIILVASVLYDLIIGAPTLVEMRACIDMYHETVTIRNHSTTEVLHQLYQYESLNSNGYLSTADLPEKSEKSL